MRFLHIQKAEMPYNFWTIFGNSDHSAAVPKAKGPMRV